MERFHLSSSGQVDNSVSRQDLARYLHDREHLIEQVNSLRLEQPQCYSQVAPPSHQLSSPTQTFSPTTMIRRSRKWGDSAAQVGAVSPPSTTTTRQWNCPSSPPPLSSPTPPRIVTTQVHVDPLSRSSSSSDVKSLLESLKPKTESIEERYEKLIQAIGERAGYSPGEHGSPMSTFFGSPRPVGSPRSGRRGDFGKAMVSSEAVPAPRVRHGKPLKRPVEAEVVDGHDEGFPEERGADVLLSLFKRKQVVGRPPSTAAPTVTDDGSESEDDSVGSGRRTIAGFRSNATTRRTIVPANIFDVDADEDEEFMHMFKNGRPNVTDLHSREELESVTPIFNKEKGMLFHIKYTNAAGRPAWAFYNDTTDWEMHVSYTFSSKSKIDISVTSKTSLSVFADGRTECKLVLYPGETGVFVIGRINGFTSSCAMKPLSAEFTSSQAMVTQNKILDELHKVKMLLGINYSMRSGAEMVKACVEKEVLFVDVKFPPQRDSVARAHETNLVPKGIITCWKRPGDYLSKTTQQPTQLICDRIEPDDIDQGHLGDCWFLCSIAAVAEFPEKVLKLLRANVENPTHRNCGAYHVCFNKHGWYEDVVVDDYLPLKGKAPAFARNREEPNELWVSIVEKAYAKIHGSYAAIVGGDALQGMQDLTGCPTIRLEKEWHSARDQSDSDKASQLFAQLVAFDESDCLIALSTPGVDEHNNNETKVNGAELKRKYDAAGLGMGHAYTVLQCKHFPQQRLRLLQIRNPWGNEVEWTGKWGDSDATSWDKVPSVARQCGYVKARDGTFWMSFEDAMEYFDSCGVCYMMSEVKYPHEFRIKGSFENGRPNVVLEVRPKKRMTMVVTLSQRDTRDGSSEKLESIMLHFASPVNGCAVGGVGRSSHHHLKPSHHPNEVEVVLNATLNLQSPTTAWTFRNARDLSMEVELVPHGDQHPYYFIPNVYDKNSNSMYVLSMYLSSSSSSSISGGVSDDVIGSGIVQFKKPDRVLGLFDNFSRFKFSGEPTRVPMQQRLVDGAVLTKYGQQAI